jgi:hypothetical protein
LWCVSGHLAQCHSTRQRATLPHFWRRYWNDISDIYIEKHKKNNQIESVTMVIIGI